MTGRNITVQESIEQYPTWQEVEAHYKEDDGKEKDVEKQTTDTATKRTSGGNALSQMLLDKLNFAPTNTSPKSTPPTSPISSGPQSSKTSPEVKNASIAVNDKSPVPPALKSLLNSVVWYVHEKDNNGAEVFFLTNSADIQHLARDFDVPTRTIHQMRDTLGAEVTSPVVTAEQPIDSDSKSEKKTLFSYEDESEEEEEVVFKPRGRGATKTSTGRGSMRHKTTGRSPRNSFSTPAAPQTPANTNGTPAQNKPKIPVEEIDPDSFDRGSFGRGSGQLANVGNHVGNYMGSGTHFNPPNGPRGGNSPRANFVSPARGNHIGRGTPRGRGLNGTPNTRGRGRLFVP
jgi:hypothetical protein